jgi:hypothetical protein
MSPILLPAQSPQPEAAPPPLRSGATPSDNARTRTETTISQQLAALDEPPPHPTTATSNSAVATRARLAPVIDGKDDDPIWAQAQIIDSFRQFQPKEDSAPSFRTVAKVVYDDKYLYVFVRMYDPHPDSIVALLSRHDQRTQSDWIKVMLDSYHDKRSGYEFAVNARGVKRDYYTYNDSQEDDSWDGIWDVATTIDSLGWTAEFQIPFDQLRFAPAPNLTMGLGIWRDIARFNERDSWPLYRRSKPGISSQIGEITGIEGLGSPRHLEIVPYVVTKNVTWPNPQGYERQQDVTGGLDLKYGVTTNLTLDGTVNPDFGQVESDPAVLNLSAFETFLPEKRPFFVEGTGIFHLDLGCNNGACTGLFYSRRIGRQPQLSDGSLSSPTSTQIYGAAKLTGRLSNGLSVGVLDALTAQADNSDGSTAEPPTNYFAARAIKESADGQSGLGAMVTATNRQNDEWTSPYLRTSAYTGGVDFRKQFSERQYELTGYLVGSTVSGSDTAMRYTQENSTHYYQRPGSGLPFDTLRTSLTGDAENISFGKIGGGVLRFNTDFQRISPGFEINDIGYIAQAGAESWSNWVGLQYEEPKSFYKQLFLNFNAYGAWSAEGISGSHLSTTSTNFNAFSELKSGWTVNFGIEGANLLGVYDDRKARGGPAMFRHPFVDWWWGIQGDPRMKVVPGLFGAGFNGSGGKSHGWGVDPQVLFTMSSNLALTVGLHYDLNIDYTQWIQNFSNGTDSVSTFAVLHQDTFKATIRLDATFTPRLSFQFFANPFISDGRYENWRKLTNPRATTYDTQFTPYAGSVPVSSYNFNDQELIVNAVLRWEYRRGSAVYLVWQHGRNYYDQSQQYSGFDPGSNFNNLLSIHPINTFLVKVNYWISL